MVKLNRSLFALALFLVQPSWAAAQPYGYSDAWSGEYEEIDGSDTGLFFGFGLTEVPYGEDAGVETEILDPGSSLVASDSNSAPWFTNIDIEYRVAASGPEGNFEVKSRHLVDSDGGGRGGWFLFAITALFVNVTNYHTAYWYNESAGVYYNWFCHNACQKSSAAYRFRSRNPRIFRGSASALPSSPTTIAE